MFCLNLYPPDKKKLVALQFFLFLDKNPLSRCEQSYCVGFQNINTTEDTSGISLVDPQQQLRGRRVRSNFESRHAHAR